MRTPKWDTELGRLLWLEGKSDGEIADELYIPTSSVTSYRRRHWEKQFIRKEDAPLGRLMTRAKKLKNMMLKAVRLLWKLHLP